MDDNFYMKQKLFNIIDNDKERIMEKVIKKNSFKPSYLRLAKSPFLKNPVYSTKNKKKSQTNISVNLNYSLNITLDKSPNHIKNSKNYESINTSFKDNFLAENNYTSKSTILAGSSTALSNSQNSENSYGNKLNKKENNNFISFYEQFTPEKKENIVRNIQKSKDNFSYECNIIDNILEDTPCENGNNIIQLMANKLINTTIFGKYLNKFPISNQTQNENSRNKKYKNLFEIIRNKNIEIFPDHIYYNYKKVEDLFNEENDNIFSYSFLKKSLFRNFIEKIKKSLKSGEKVLIHHSLSKKKFNDSRNYFKNYFSVPPRIKRANKYLSISNYVSENNSIEKIKKKNKFPIRIQTNEIDWDNNSDIFEPLLTSRGPFKGRKNSVKKKMNLSDLILNTNEKTYSKNNKKLHSKTNSTGISPYIKNEKQNLNMSTIDYKNEIKNNHKNNNIPIYKSIHFPTLNNNNYTKKRNKNTKILEKLLLTNDKGINNTINNNIIFEPLDLKCIIMKPQNDILKTIKTFFKENNFFLNIKGYNIKSIQANTHIEINIVKFPYIINGFYLKVKLKNWVNSQEIINSLLNILNK